MSLLQNDGGEFVDRDTEERERPGIDEPSEETATCPLDYFESLPNEMMMKVFSKLKHPKDLISCSRVGRRWECILQSQNTSFYFYEALPYFSKHLELTENLLELRLVCKSWKIAVEDHLDGKYHRTTFPNKCSTLGCWVVPFYQSDDMVRGFLSSVENLHPHYNPIPTRGISFNPEFDGSDHEHPDEIKPLVLPFLRKFGQHIWRSQVPLDFQNDEGTTLDMETLFACLRQMPNLKHFVVIGPEGCLPLSPEEEQRHLDYVNTHAHPTLGNLLTLSAYTYPLPLLQAMLRACCDVLEEFACGPCIPSFENLNFLRLSSLHISANDDEHDHVPSLVQLNAPMLVELQLAFDLDQGDISPLAEALQNFGESLEVLRLEENHCDYCGYLNIDEFGELNLQRLRKFEIHSFQLESFDFLPGFAPFLEHFIVNVRPCYWYHQKTHVIKRNSIGIEGFGFECVCNSEIWNILPNLKTICIRIWGTRREGRTCSRENRDNFEKQRIRGCDQAGAVMIPCPFYENSDNDSDFDSDELGEDMEGDFDLGSNSDDDIDLY